MPKVEATATIAAPPEKIWALMCDPHRYPEFAEPTQRMIEVPDSEFAVGYTYREYGGIKPFLGESTWTVTEFRPMSHQVHEGDDGQMHFNLTIDVTPTNGGTFLHQTVELRPRWYLAPVSALLWPLMMRRRSQEAMDKTVANVKRMCEVEG